MTSIRINSEFLYKKILIMLGHYTETSMGDLINLLNTPLNKTIIAEVSY